MAAQLLLMPIAMLIVILISDRRNALRAQRRRNERRARRREDQRVWNETLARLNGARDADQKFAAAPDRSTVEQNLDL